MANIDKNQNPVFNLCKNILQSENFLAVELWEELSGKTIYPKRDGRADGRTWVKQYAPTFSCEGIKKTDYNELVGEPTKMTCCKFGSGFGDISAYSGSIFCSFGHISGCVFLVMSKFWFTFKHF